jgi:hypothetical protein
MANFGGPEDVIRWIEAGPVATRRHCATVLASRAALRVWPVLVRELDQVSERRFGELRLAGAQANAVAWAAAKYPARASELRSAAAAADTAALVADATGAVVVAAAAAAATASSAAAVAHAAAQAADAAAAAADAAAYASDAQDYALARTMIWRTVSSDATLLDAPGDSLSPTDLPLWGVWRADTVRGGQFESAAVPSWIDGNWTRLRGELLRRQGENWRVWVDWYHEVLYGRPPWPALNEKQREDLAVAIALIDDKVWKQGPVVANAKVKQLIDAAHAQTLPGEDGLQKQVGSAAQFVAGPDGAIGLAPPGPEDRLSDTPAVRDFYRECREKARDIKQMGSQILGEVLGRRIDKFLSRAPADFSQALERDVWSVGNSLRSVRNAHVAVQDRTDLDILGHPAKLDTGAAEALGDWVDTFNQLAFADSKLLARDNLRPGPQEHDRAKEEIDLAIPLVREAIRQPGVLSADAVEELNEQQAAVANAGVDLAGKQQADHARNTYGNLFAEVVLSVCRAIRSVPSLARGEGGFVSREYAGGFYKEAGKRTFDAVLIGGAAAVYFCPQAVDFVLLNLDQFQAYCAVAFEHAPGAAQLLRWLEANAAKAPRGERR